MSRSLFIFSLLALIAGCSSSENGTPRTDDTQDELRKKRICGGIAGLQCPSGYECVDDPSDTCDPQNGGADCSGVCQKKTAPPPPPPPATRTCGGFAGIQCPSGFDCVDDPNDSCDPNNGGADCGGICKKHEAAPQMCGGFAGIQCPSGYKCVDDPSDSCDPQNGGADCSGICQPK